jgi:hypothetical protein
VDLSKKITPIMVRDAILVCFEQAHKESLDIMDEFTEWKSDEDRSKVRDLHFDMTIKSAFKYAKADYHNPNKEGLVKVIDYLVKIASNF